MTSMGHGPKFASAANRVIAQQFEQAAPLLSKNYYVPLNKLDNADADDKERPDFLKRMDSNLLKTLGKQDTNITKNSTTYYTPTVMINVGTLLGESLESYGYDPDPTKNNFGKNEYAYAEEMVVVHSVGESIQQDLRDLGINAYFMTYPFAGATSKQNTADQSLIVVPLYELEKLQPNEIASEIEARTEHLNPNENSIDARLFKKTEEEVTREQTRIVDTTDKMANLAAYFSGQHFVSQRFLDKGFKDKKYPAAQELAKQLTISSELEINNILPQDRPAAVGKHTSILQMLEFTHTERSK